MIPILAYIYKFPILSGAFVTINWILFLLKDKINKIFLYKYSQTKIIVASYSVLSIIYLILYLFGKQLNIIEICIILLFQGGISGLAEEFWMLEDMNNKMTQNIWKISGIIGSIISVLLSLNNKNWQIYFIVPVFLTGLLSIIYIGSNLWKK